MSSPSLVNRAELPSWDSCADQLAQVYCRPCALPPKVTCEKTTATELHKPLADFPRLALVDDERR